MRKAAKAKVREMMMAMAAAAAETQTLSALITLLTRPYQLCLPAPVVDPAMAALSELKTKLESRVAA